MPAFFSSNICTASFPCTIWHFRSSRIHSHTILGFFSPGFFYVFLCWWVIYDRRSLTGWAGYLRLSDTALRLVHVNNWHWKGQFEPNIMILEFLQQFQGWLFHYFSCLCPITGVVAAVGAQKMVQHANHKVVMDQWELFSYDISVAAISKLTSHDCWTWDANRLPRKIRMQLPFKTPNLIVVFPSSSDDEDSHANFCRIYGV